MTRVTGETVHLDQRAEEAAYPVYVPEAAPERVLVLLSWDAGAHHRDRYPLTAPRPEVRVEVRVKCLTFSTEEDPSTTQIHVPEEFPCHHHPRNAAL